MVLKCPSLQPIRDCYPAIFGGAVTMRSVMNHERQHDVMNFVVACFDWLEAQEQGPSLAR